MVIAIVGTLIALLLPAVQAARESARRSSCANRFRQLVTALHVYESGRRQFPHGFEQTDQRGESSCGARDRYPQVLNRYSWVVLILPQLEEQPLYDQFDLDQDYFATVNRGPAASTLTAVLCPSDQQGGELVGCCSGFTMGEDPDEDVRQSNVAGVADSVDWTCNGIAAKDFTRSNGFMGERYGAQASEIYDGLSNTFAIGEVTGGGPNSYSGHFWVSWLLLDTQDGINGPNTAVGGTWAPDEVIDGSTYTGFRNTGFSSWHPNGCHFAYADGSVHFMSDMTSAEVMAALTTRDGRESVGGGAP